MGARPRAYLPRIAEETVERLLRQFPVVVVTGARQTGKTTMVQNLASAPRRTFLSLDDPDTLDLARGDPEVLLESAARLTIDEVQRHPDLLLAIKRVVDRKRTRGRFLLTGSANLLLMAGVAESLAGRAAYLYLRPMTEPEKAGAPRVGPWIRLLSAASAEEALKTLPGTPARPFPWTRAVLEGGFPVAAQERDLASRRTWFEGYVRTYVERDLRQLSQIESLLDFRRLMNLLALRVGRLVNQADIARDAGLSHATAHRYLNLLETSFLIARVPAYSVNRTKRLLKMPKLYWADTGLASYLAGAHAGTDLRSHESGGALLENLLWHHLQSSVDTAPDPVGVLTWRTVSGQEVDFVLESRRRLLPIEVKASRRVTSEDARNLETFLDEYEDLAPFGVVVHGGAEARLVTRRVVAIPLSLALGSR